MADNNGNNNPKNGGEQKATPPNTMNDKLLDLGKDLMEAGYNFEIELAPDSPNGVFQKPQNGYYKSGSKTGDGYEKNTYEEYKDGKKTGKTAEDYNLNSNLSDKQAEELGFKYDEIDQSVLGRTQRLDRSKAKQSLSKKHNVYTSKLSDEKPDGTFTLAEMRRRGWSVGRNTDLSMVNKKAGVSQSTWQKLGRSALNPLQLGSLIIGEGIGGMMEAAGSGIALFWDDGDYSNWLTKAGEGFRDAINKPMNTGAIYGDDTFSWALRGGTQLMGEISDFVLSTALTGVGGFAKAGIKTALKKGAKAALKLNKKAKQLNSLKETLETVSKGSAEYNKLKSQIDMIESGLKVSKGLDKGFDIAHQIGSTAYTGYTEGAASARSVYNNMYQYHLSQGKTVDEAKAAAKAGAKATVMSISAVSGLLNVTSVAPLFKNNNLLRNSITSKQKKFLKKGVGESDADYATRLLGSKDTRAKDYDDYLASRSKLEKFKDFVGSNLHEPIQEGIEEGLTSIGEKYGESVAKNYFNNIEQQQDSAEKLGLNDDEYLIDANSMLNIGEYMNTFAKNYASREVGESFFWGMIGGMLIPGAIKMLPSAVVGGEVYATYSKADKEAGLIPEGKEVGDYKNPVYTEEDKEAGTIPEGKVVGDVKSNERVKISTKELLTNWSNYKQNTIGGQEKLAVRRAFNNAKFAIGQDMRRVEKLKQQLKSDLSDPSLTPEERELKASETKRQLFSSSSYRAARGGFLDPLKQQLDSIANIDNTEDISDNLREELTSIDEEIAKLKEANASLEGEEKKTANVELQRLLIEKSKIESLLASGQTITEAMVLGYAKDTNDNFYKEQAEEAKKNLDNDSKHYKRLVNLYDEGDMESEMYIQNLFELHTSKDFYKNQYDKTKKALTDLKAERLKKIESIYGDNAYIIDDYLSASDQLKANREEALSLNAEHEKLIKRLNNKTLSKQAINELKRSFPDLHARLVQINASQDMSKDEKAMAKKALAMEYAERKQGIQIQALNAKQKKLEQKKIELASILANENSLGGKNETFRFLLGKDKLSENELNKLTEGLKGAIEGEVDLEIYKGERQLATLDARMASTRGAELWLRSVGVRADHKKAYRDYMEAYIKDGNSLLSKLGEEQTKERDSLIDSLKKLKAESDKNFKGFLPGIYFEENTTFEVDPNGNILVYSNGENIETVNREDFITKEEQDILDDFIDITRQIEYKQKAIQELNSKSQEIDEFVFKKWNEENSIGQDEVKDLALLGDKKKLKETVTELEENAQLKQNEKKNKQTKIGQKARKKGRKLAAALVAKYKTTAERSNEAEKLQDEINKIKEDIANNGTDSLKENNLSEALTKLNKLKKESEVGEATSNLIDVYNEIFDSSVEKEDRANGTPDDVNTMSLEEAYALSAANDQAKAELQAELEELKQQQNALKPKVEDIQTPYRHHNVINDATAKVAKDLESAVLDILPPHLAIKYRTGELDLNKSSEELERDLFVFTLAERQRKGEISPRDMHYALTDYDNEIANRKKEAEAVEAIIVLEDRLNELKAKDTEDQTVIDEIASIENEINNLQLSIGISVQKSEKEIEAEKELKEQENKVKDLEEKASKEKETTTEKTLLDMFKESEAEKDEKTEKLVQQYKDEIELEVEILKEKRENLEKVKQEEALRRRTTAKALNEAKKGFGILNLIKALNSEEYKEVEDVELGGTKKIPDSPLAKFKEKVETLKKDIEKKKKDRPYKDSDIEAALNRYSNEFINDLEDLIKQEKLNFKAHQEIVSRAFMDLDYKFERSLNSSEVFARWNNLVKEETSKLNAQLKEVNNKIKDLESKLDGKSLDGLNEIEEKLSILHKERAILTYNVDKQKGMLQQKFNNKIVELLSPVLAQEELDILNSVVDLSQKIQNIEAQREQLLGEYNELSDYLKELNQLIPTIKDKKEQKEYIDELKSVKDKRDNLDKKRKALYNTAQENYALLNGSIDSLSSVREVIYSLEQEAFKLNAEELTHSLEGKAMPVTKESLESKLEALNKKRRERANKLLQEAKGKYEPSNMLSELFKKLEEGQTTKEVLTDSNVLENAINKVNSILKAKEEKSKALTENEKHREEKDKVEIKPIVSILEILIKNSEGVDGITKAQTMELLNAKTKVLEQLKAAEEKLSENNREQISDLEKQYVEKLREFYELYESINTQKNNVDGINSRLEELNESLKVIEKELQKSIEDKNLLNSEVEKSIDDILEIEALDLDQKIETFKTAAKEIIKNKAKASLENKKPDQLNQVEFGHKLNPSGDLELFTNGVTNVYLINPDGKIELDKTVTLEADDSRDYEFSATKVTDTVSIPEGYSYLIISNPKPKQEKNKKKNRGVYYDVDKEAVKLAESITNAKKGDNPLKNTHKNNTVAFGIPLHANNLGNTISSRDLKMLEGLEQEVIQEEQAAKETLNPIEYHTTRHKEAVMHVLGNINKSFDDLDDTVGDQPVGYKYDLPKEGETVFKHRGKDGRLVEIKVYKDDSEEFNPIKKGYVTERYTGSIYDAESNTYLKFPVIFALNSETGEKSFVFENDPKDLVEDYIEKVKTNLIEKLEVNDKTKTDEDGVVKGDDTEGDKDNTGGKDDEGDGDGNKDDGDGDDTEGGDKDKPKPPTDPKLPPTPPTTKDLDPEDNNTYKNINNLIKESYSEGSLISFNELPGSHFRIANVLAVNKTDEGANITFELEELYVDDNGIVQKRNKKVTLGMDSNLSFILSENNIAELKELKANNAKVESIDPRTTQEGIEAVRSFIRMVKVRANTDNPMTMGELVSKLDEQNFRGSPLKAYKAILISILGQNEKFKDIIIDVESPQDFKDKNLEGIAAISFSEDGNIPPTIHLLDLDEAVVSGFITNVPNAVEFEISFMHEAVHAYTVNTIYSTEENEDRDRLFNFLTQDLAMNNRDKVNEATTESEKLEIAKNGLLEAVALSNDLTEKEKGRVEYLIRYIYQEPDVNKNLHIQRAAAELVAIARTDPAFIKFLSSLESKNEEGEVRTLKDIFFNIFKKFLMKSLGRTKYDDFLIIMEDLFPLGDIDSTKKPTGKSPTISDDDAFELELENKKRDLLKKILNKERQYFKYTNQDGVTTELVIVDNTIPNMTVAFIEDGMVKKAELNSDTFITDVISGSEINYKEVEESTKKSILDKINNSNDLESLQKIAKIFTPVSDINNINYYKLGKPSRDELIAAFNSKRNKLINESRIEAKKEYLAKIENATTMDSVMATIAEAFGHNGIKTPEYKLMVHKFHKAEVVNAAIAKIKEFANMDSESKSREDAYLKKIASLTKLLEFPGGKKSDINDQIYLAAEQLLLSRTADLTAFLEVLLDPNSNSMKEMAKVAAIEAMQALAVRRPHLKGAKDLNSLSRADREVYEKLLEDIIFDKIESKVRATYMAYLGNESSVNTAINERISYYEQNIDKPDSQYHLDKLNRINEVAKSFKSRLSYELFTALGGHTRRKYVQLNTATPRQERNGDLDYIDGIVYTVIDEDGSGNVELRDMDGNLHTVPSSHIFEFIKQSPSKKLKEFISSSEQMFRMFTIEPRSINFLDSKTIEAKLNDYLDLVDMANAMDEYNRIEFLNNAKNSLLDFFGGDTKSSDNKDFFKDIKEFIGKAETGSLEKDSVPNFSSKLSEILYKNPVKNRRKDITSNLLYDQVKNIIQKGGSLNDIARNITIVVNTNGVETKQKQLDALRKKLEKRGELREDGVITTGQLIEAGIIKINPTKQANTGKDVIGVYHGDTVNLTVMLNAPVYDSEGNKTEATKQVAIGMLNNPNVFVKCKAGRTNGIEVYHPGIILNKYRKAKTNEEKEALLDEFFELYDIDDSYLSELGQAPKVDIFGNTTAVTRESLLIKFGEQYNSMSEFYNKMNTYLLNSGKKSFAIPYSTFNSFLDVSTTGGRFVFNNSSTNNLSLKDVASNKAYHPFEGLNSMVLIDAGLPTEQFYESNIENTKLLIDEDELQSVEQLEKVKRALKNDVGNLSGKSRFYMVIRNGSGKLRVVPVKTRNLNSTDSSEALNRLRDSFVALSEKHGKSKDNPMGTVIAEPNKEGKGIKYNEAYDAIKKEFNNQFFGIEDDGAGNTTSKLFFAVNRNENQGRIIVEVVPKFKKPPSTILASRKDKALGFEDLDTSEVYFKITRFNKNTGTYDKPETHTVSIDNIDKFLQTLNNVPGRLAVSNPAESNFETAINNFKLPLNPTNPISDVGLKLVPDLTRVDGPMEDLLSSLGENEPEDDTELDPTEENPDLSPEEQYKKEEELKESLDKLTSLTNFVINNFYDGKSSFYLRDFAGMTLSEMIITFERNILVNDKGNGIYSDILTELTKAKTLANELGVEPEEIQATDALLGDIKKSLNKGISKFESSVRYDQEESLVKALDLKLKDAMSEYYASGNLTKFNELQTHILELESLVKLTELIEDSKFNEFVNNLESTIDRITNMDTGSFNIDMLSNFDITKMSNSELEVLVSLFDGSDLDLSDAFNEISTLDDLSKLPEVLNKLKSNLKDSFNNVENSYLTSFENIINAFNPKSKNEVLEILDYLEDLATGDFKILETIKFLKKNFKGRMYKGKFSFSMKTLIKNRKNELSDQLNAKLEETTSKLLLNNPKFVTKIKDESGNVVGYIEHNLDPNKLNFTNGNFTSATYDTKLYKYKDGKLVMEQGTNVVTDLDALSGLLNQEGVNNVDSLQSFLSNNPSFKIDSADDVENDESLNFEEENNFVKVGSEGQAFSIVDTLADSLSIEGVLFEEVSELKVGTESFEDLLDEEIEKDEEFKANILLEFKRFFNTVNDKMGYEIFPTNSFNSDLEDYSSEDILMYSSLYGMARQYFKDVPTEFKVNTKTDEQLKVKAAIADMGNVEFKYFNLFKNEFDFLLDAEGKLGDTPLLINKKFEYGLIYRLYNNALSDNDFTVLVDEDSPVRLGYLESIVKTLDDDDLTNAYINVSVDDKGFINDLEKKHKGC